MVTKSFKCDNPEVWEEFTAYLNKKRVWVWEALEPMIKDYLEKREVGNNGIIHERGSCSDSQGKYIG